jgi:hypothetical protein
VGDLGGGQGWGGVRECWLPSAEMRSNIPRFIDQAFMRHLDTYNLSLSISKVLVDEKKLPVLVK